MAKRNFGALREVDVLDGPRDYWEFWKAPNLYEAMLRACDYDEDRSRLDAGLYEVTGVRWKQSPDGRGQLLAANSKVTWGGPDHLPEFRKQRRKGRMEGIVLLLAIVTAVSLGIALEVNSRWVWPAAASFAFALLVERVLMGRYQGLMDVLRRTGVIAGVNALLFVLVLAFIAEASS